MQTIEDVLTGKRRGIALCGDCREVLKGLPDGCVQMCVTSPPYWGLRDYGVEPSIWGGDPACEHEWREAMRTGGGKQNEEGKRWQHTDGGVSGHGKARSGFCSKCGAWRGVFGLEPMPELYVEHAVTIFREVRRVLRDDGTLWLNLGDSYAHDNPSGPQGKSGQRNNRTFTASESGGLNHGLKPKDLVGIPWRVAFALQADGWWLRQDIIWAKCLSGGVMLYAKTQKGVMPTMLKDLVRLDPATVQLWNGQKWTQVVSWTEQPRPDSPLEIMLRSGERIGCTAEHRWPTQRGLVRSDELQHGDAIDSCRLPGKDHNNPRYLDRLGWYVGHYIAEGSRSGSTLQIACHVNQMAEFFEEWKALAECFGGSAHCHKTGGKAGTINVECKMVMAFIDQYVAGRTAKDKHLTRAAWHNNDMWLYDLLEGYLRGDGHDAGSVWKLGFTQNDYWAADLRAIAARIGASIHLCRTVHKCNGKEYPGWRGTLATPSYRKSRCPDTQVVSIGKSRARHFYDVQVADEPHVFALASGVLTHNSNPMPESVTDRCTKAHEYIFLLTKQPRYFYDAEAVKEEAIHAGKVVTNDNGKNAQMGEYGQTREGFLKPEGVTVGSNRNRRSVWTIPTAPFKAAHFATFPPNLVRPCILAGTSEKGRCPKCGAPWYRSVDKHRSSTRPAVDSKTFEHTASEIGNRDPERHCTETTTIGWKPSCQCGVDETLPCIVLDPFGGSLTVAQVAVQERRSYVMVELKQEYIALGKKHRLAADMMKRMKEKEKQVKREKRAQKKQGAQRPVTLPTGGGEKGVSC